jgi:hypothetical protein
VHFLELFFALFVLSLSQLCSFSGVAGRLLRKRTWDISIGNSVRNGVYRAMVRRAYLTKTDMSEILIISYCVFLKSDSAFQCVRQCLVDVNVII